MIKKLKSIIRSVKIRIQHFIGSLLVKNRMLPQFVILGAQKGGTSSLFFYLKGHPQVKRAIKKEIHYFNIFFEKGLSWYKAHFPAKSHKYITGEASPGYLYHPDAAQRMYNINPNTKLIVLVRNPIHRAYSAFQMNKRMGIDPRANFEEAIQFELKHPNKDDESYDYDRHNYFYLARGKYAQQLDNWLAYYSKDQILIIESDYFFTQTKEALVEVYSFLDLKPIFPKDLRAMNVGKYPPLSDATYESLKAYYKGDMELLKKKWNIEFSL